MPCAILESSNCDISRRKTLYKIVCDVCLLLIAVIMFRTAARRFAATAWRAAGTVENKTMAEVEREFAHGIDVSRAQGIASRGFIDGRCSWSRHLAPMLTLCSYREDSHDQAEAAI